jgi:hypothetical protein
MMQRDNKKTHAGLRKNRWPTYCSRTAGWKSLAWSALLFETVFHERTAVGERNTRVVQMRFLLCIPQWSWHAFITEKPVVTWLITRQTHDIIIINYIPCNHLLQKCLKNKFPYFPDTSVGRYSCISMLCLIWFFVEPLRKISQNSNIITKTLIIGLLLLLLLLLN